MSSRSSILRIVFVFLLLGAAVIAIGFGVFRHALEQRRPWALKTFAAYFGRSIAGQRVVDTSVRIELFPDEGRLRAKASLTVESAEPERRGFHFLLNPGLRVSSATIAGTPAAVARRWCGLSVKSPQSVGIGERAHIELTYEGRMAPSSFDRGWITVDEVVLPPLSFWRPIDLQSFSSFRCEVTLGEEFRVVADGAKREDAPEAGRCRVSWSEPRPVLGVTLAAGRFESASRVHGGVRCSVYWPEGKTIDSEPFLEASGNAYNFYCSRFGSDGFKSVSLVVSSKAQRSYHGGNSVIVLSEDCVDDEAGVFVRVAHFVAQNWWGGTVAGRWLSAKPEAGEWIVESMAEYSAWLALRNRKGREPYLRFIEGLRCPPTIHSPMKTLTLFDRLAGGADTDAFVQVRGPFVAAMLHDHVGREDFIRACRNFLEIHRCSTVSFASFRQELELASQMKLDEFLRVWFDRPGTFDYALDDVEFVGTKARVTVSNQGDIPAQMELDVAFVSERGPEFRRLDPDAREGTLEFEVRAPIKRVILDPFFVCPDMIRANNVWPRQVWPCGIAAAPDGTLAVATKSEWTGSADGVTIVDLAGGYVERIVFPQPLTEDPAWSPDGQRLTLKTDRVRYWDRAQGVRNAKRSGPKGADRAELPVQGYQPAGDWAWTADAKAVVFLDQSGKLMRLAPERPSTETLLDLGYRVREAAVAADGSRVAWRDPAGRLRTANVDRPIPEYVQAPGEVIAYAWEGSKALVCLVAETPPTLPMLCHAEYSLWRADVSSVEAERLDFDPTRVSQ